MTASTATCSLATPLDAIVLAGMGGEDAIATNGFPATVGVIVTGGEGGDELIGGETEDVLVDGPGGGGDELSALGGDDALLHNGGADARLGGEGNDLFLSVSICDDDLLLGGPGRDNASWARLVGEGVGARLDQGRAGEPDAGGALTCPGDAFDTLQEFEDLEGSGSADAFFGDLGPNQLLGHGGPDVYFAQAGNDSILANSGDSDPTIDCGEGTDSAVIDIPSREPPDEYEDAAPVTARPSAKRPRTASGRPPNFRRRRSRSSSRGHRLPTANRLGPGSSAGPPSCSSPPGPAAGSSSASPPTSAARASAASSTRRPYRPCASPRAFTVGRGAHAVRIVAIDAAGNADPTPALFRFRVRVP